MPLRTAFELAASGTADASPVSESRRKRPAPFSLRLTKDERARLVTEAAGAPLGAFIKAKLLDGPMPKPVRQPRAAPLADRTALAQCLALLGRARIANNLNQLAHLANIGALPVDPETVADLTEAVEAVREMRRLLMAALGLKPEAAR
ncbi:MAG: plasmid mobilization relaxosome protein MobC [Methylorubrum rhodinum]|uniref:plasmid mobilization relaxosome protein MobC n=1 Tax=Methylorubrum rhodinum TaxID=29428 RepID=UPI003BAE67B2